MARATVYDGVLGVRTPYVSMRGLPVNHISKVADAITFPARTAVGAARLGLSTTLRVVGWAVERAGGPAPQHPSSSFASVTVPPVTVPAPAPEDLGAAPQADPMEATVTAPKKAVARKAPEKKVPADQVPLKSAPTPSLPAALASFDEDDDVAVPTPAARKAPAKKAAAKKTAAKKAPAKKAPAKKAPSKQAAVLAPALGLSEAEVAEVAGDVADD